jgi:hypothetical protein
MVVHTGEKDGWAAEASAARQGLQRQAVPGALGARLPP